MCSERGSGIHQLLNASNCCFIFKKTLFCLFICECLCVHLYVCLRAQGMATMWISQDSLQDWDFSSHCVGSSNQTQVIILSAFTPTTTCWPLLFSLFNKATAFRNEIKEKPLVLALGRL